MTKRILLSVLFVAGLTSVLASSQPWLRFTFVEGFSTSQVLEVSGNVASPLTFALSIATLAAVAAVSIARRIARVLLLILLATMAVGLVVTTVSAISAPVLSTITELATVTGLRDEQALSGQIDEITIVFWAYINLVSATAVFAFSFVGVWVSPRWKDNPSRYKSAASSVDPDETRTADQAPDRIDDWDALSAGADPSA